MKISIITICFNSGRYLERAIQSVVSQDYKEWEHIVIDGGSKDETLDILQKYKHLIWISESDEGQSDAMNKGFKRSSGNIIIYLNADDELNPGLLTNVVRHFKAYTDTDILVLDLDTIKEDGKIITTKPSTSLYEILFYYKYRFPLNPVSYAYKRNLQDKIGPFPVDNHYAMDYWFLIRAYLFGKVRHENFTGGIFYFDGNNKSADQEKSGNEMKKVRNQFLRQYFYRRAIIKFNIKLMRTKLHYTWLGIKKLSVNI